MMNTNRTLKNQIKFRYAHPALLGFGCLVAFACFFATGFIDQSPQSSVALTADAATGDAADEQEAVKRQAKQSFLKLPLMFEANKGQVDSDVKFFSRGVDYNLFLTPTEAVISLHKQTKDSEKKADETAVLQMKLSNGNANAKVSGERKCRQS
jgi:hypothetical protein